jgi:SAM-dependent methyltransferase
MRILGQVKRIAFHEKSPLKGLQRLLYRVKPYRWKFVSHYRNWGWGQGESVSGPGSSLEATQRVRVGLEDVFRQYQVRTFIDLPCGDFHWMKTVDLSGLDYFGIDIVRELVEENTRKFGTDHVRFLCADLLKDRLQAVDLVLCRDCLVHYPSKLILRAVRNLRASGSRLLLTTTFPPLPENRELETPGLFRQINLQKAPFDFPEPMLLIEEGMANGKSLGLWRLADLCGST